jgi:hypothetical protein
MCSTCNKKALKRLLQGRSSERMAIEPWRQSTARTTTTDGRTPCASAMAIRTTIRLALPTEQDLAV